MVRAMRGVTPALSACRRPLHRRLMESGKAYRVTAAIARNSSETHGDLFNLGRPQQDGSLGRVREVYQIKVLGCQTGVQSNFDPHRFSGVVSNHSRYGHIKGLAAVRLADAKREPAGLLPFLRRRGQSARRLR